jgi:hypothetical protein
MEAQVTRYGSKREARKALQGLLKPVMRRGFDGVLREARGASRAAYESHDRKVVYKVCHEADYEDNRNEAETVAILRKSPLGAQYVAPVTPWNINGIIVNAMPAMAMTGREFINGCHDGRVCNAETPCSACKADDDITTAADNLGVSDMHEANWGIDPSGRAWIIDCNIAYITPAKPISFDVRRSDNPFLAPQPSICPDCLGRHE